MSEPSGKILDAFLRKYGASLGGRMWVRSILTNDKVRARYINDGLLSTVEHYDQSYRWFAAGYRTGKRAK